MTTVTAAVSRLPLPKPRVGTHVSLEQALLRRRSWRTFADSPLALADLGQLLWAAQGITGHYGLRTAPSAGSLYPLVLQVVAARVDGLPAGIYRYLPKTHDLECLAEGDFRADLKAATGQQECLGSGAVDLVIAASFRATVERYGQDCGRRFVHLEAGHAAQNVCLQATALGLATTTVASFDEGAMAAAARLAEGEEALYVLPVGHPGRGVRGMGRA